jgi:hypothetical protein
MSAIASGMGHIAGGDGDAPGDLAAACGWRYRGSLWEPQGKRIGWITADGIFLEPDASYRAAQDAAGGAGDALVIAPQTLRKRLQERGFLQGADGTRTTARKRIGGTVRMVLWLTAGALPLFCARTARTARTEPVELPFSGPETGVRP